MLILENHTESLSTTSLKESAPIKKIKMRWSSIKLALMRMPEPDQITRGWCGCPKFHGAIGAQTL